MHDDQAAHLFSHLNKESILIKRASSLIEANKEI